MFVLPDLPYDYSSLAPHISQDIMELHHKRHHQTYVDRLNAALEQVPELAALPIEELIGNIERAPEAVRGAIRNHGGGHYNHSQFWQWMSPDGGDEPTGELFDAIVAKYGSFTELQQAFDTAATGLFGSGWTWLMPDLSIITTSNQDNPIMNGQPAPILGLDVWEHAYYLDYTYQRPAYITAWWNVVNWAHVAELYA